MQNTSFQNTLFTLLFFFCGVVSFSQESSSNTETDTLINLDYKSLRKNINPKDSLNSFIYIQSYLKKAKNEKDTLRMAKAYRYHLFFCQDKNILSYTDSIIRITKDKNYKKYPMLGYFLKGLELYNRKDFNEALDNFLEAKKQLPQDNPDIESNIGLIKSRLGLYEEALAIFKKTLKHYKKQKYNYEIQASYCSIGEAFRLLKQMDSSIYYNELGYNFCKRNIDKGYQNYFLLNIGATLSDSNELELSQRNLKKALPTLLSSNDKPNLALCHFFLGRNYKNLGNIEKSLYHLKKMDSIFLEVNDLHPELRQGYEILINYYKGNKDLKNQLTYVSRILSLDSIIKLNYRYLYRKLTKEYDEPKLLVEQKRINSEIKHSKNNLYYLLLFSISIIVLTVILLLYKQYKHKQERQKFEEIFNEYKRREIKRESRYKPNNGLGLKEDLIKNIVSKLEVFENKKGFIDSKLTRNDLAKKFDTNPKYLSNIINYHSGKTYTNYINDLRIDYAITQLTNNSNLLNNYTLNGIAKEVGFNYTEPFSKAFFKKTGIKPSSFIKNLKKSPRIRESC